MDLTENLQCPCRPGFFYKRSLSVHKKSKTHQAWETSSEVRNLRIENKNLENRLAQKENVERALLARIRELEGQLEYWRVQTEGF
jgi:hypothetical protein